MSEDSEKRVRVRGYIRTNKVGSECEFDFFIEVPAELSGDELADHVEEEARDAAFGMMEWNFTVEDVE